MQVQTKTVKVHDQEGHTLHSKYSCFGSLVFDDAGKRANGFVLFHRLMQPVRLQYELFPCAVGNKTSMS